MATKDDLRRWLLDALRAQGGQATVVQVAKRVWADHEDDLRHSGDLFFTWQYDLRWAAHALRREGRLRSVEDSPRGVWQLV